MSSGAASNHSIEGNKISLNLHLKHQEYTYTIQK
jgi:hypothetical protein